MSEHDSEHEALRGSSVYIDEEEYDPSAVQPHNKPTHFIEVNLPLDQKEIKLQEQNSSASYKNGADEPYSSSKEGTPPAQSKLHNCPKHLIKFLAQALELRRLHTKQYIENLPIMEADELTAFKDLLQLIWQAYRGTLKTSSKELLKIVFETGAEGISRLKLLQNSAIKACFRRHEEKVIDRTKEILRDYTFQRLEDSRARLIEDSRLLLKDVNMKYIKLFMRELKEGTIKERMSKRDKMHMFGQENDENQP